MTILRNSQLSPERRKRKRFHVKVPVTFTWKKSGGGPFTGKGITRDMSANGAYVVSDTVPPINAIVLMKVHIPQFYGSGSLLITATMRALRIDRAAGGKEGGFSLVGRGFVFEAVEMM